ncbi:hydroxysqualene dehydroxylase [Salipaludibacillus aurantiacus]|uniref:15-cis-phytoene desaturase n=1 Tax=Salipaludibacillus aurantiacus TaxID=1601833 RepID=A0A1H9V1H7_9BACI|nr:FAD-dependent oxidoreductase [Salipaludibacillus aurantiacus]SES15449.1 15-cis-phytoene desaturase [Salipaludibacillus aurantiacus]
MDEDVIIIGGGLAGLTAALNLCEKGYRVLLLEKRGRTGGRCSTWKDKGMTVQSGFHRYFSNYSEMKKVMRQVGVNIEDFILWQNKMDILIPDKKETAVFGIAPISSPLAFLQGIIGNSHVLSRQDKYSVLRFIFSGIKDFMVNSRNLENESVQGYAERHKITPNAYSTLISPSTYCLFFLPPEEFSAKAYFDFFVPALFARMGTYKGSLKEVVSDPLTEGIKSRGGKIKLSSCAERLIIKDNQVKGIKLNSGDILTASHFILATPLREAQPLLRESVGSHPWFAPMINMPTTSGLSIEIDLNEPALAHERMTLGPQTALLCFAEQSRSALKHLPGRLSALLGHPERLINLSDQEIYKLVLADAKKLGMDLKPHIINYKVVRHSGNRFHSGPDYNWMRPDQKTPVKGLTLAGDYTKQPFNITTEGAVISGKKAAQVILDDKERI